MSGKKERDKLTETAAHAGAAKVAAGARVAVVAGHTVGQRGGDGAVARAADAARIASAGSRGAIGIARADRLQGGMERGRAQQPSGKNRARNGVREAGGAERGKRWRRYQSQQEKHEHVEAALSV
jgi:hypothetical protein